MVLIQIYQANSQLCEFLNDKSPKSPPGGIKRSKKPVCWAGPWWALMRGLPRPSDPEHSYACDLGKEGGGQRIKGWAQISVCGDGDVLKMGCDDGGTDL